LEFSQFLKIESSFIRHWDVSDNSLFAMRYFGGIAIPFGNSNNIPFSESFFGGGSNDNRAWEVYKLGPGSSGAKNEFNEANLKLALNLEYRFKMFGNFNGAIFTDIGNIWNVFDDTEEESRSFNGFEDLNELAIGSGIGVRYDSGLFIFRLDMGLKTYNPALIKKDRWFNDFSLKKAVFNIGLNYPF
jgi:outer membrane protein assembly factor BamA